MRRQIFFKNDPFLKKSETGTAEPAIVQNRLGTGTVEPLNERNRSGTGTAEPLKSRNRLGTGTVEPRKKLEPGEHCYYVQYL